MSYSVPDLKFHNGNTMPVHGLGTWLSKPGEVEKAAEAAIDCGYRLIDTALVYGNEAEIGKAIQTKIKEEKIKREDIFVTTKNWVTYFSREQVMESVKISLKNLQLEYVDLYLLHAPCAMKRANEGINFDIVDGKPVPEEIDHEETWKGMEDVYNAGLAKAIGLSNFSAAQIQNIYDKAAVKPHNLQVEMHIYFPQEELRELCSKLKMTMTSYATLGSPGRILCQPKDRKIEWPNPGVTMEDPIVLEISKAHNKSAAQVLLRWAMQKGVAIIPKSVNPERVKQNIQVFDFELSENDMKKLDNVSIRQRLFLQDWGKGHPKDPFADERK